MIVAILEERDCGAFLESLSLFSDARQAGGVRVHALLLGNSPSPADVDRLRGGARLRFPVTAISPRRGYALLRSLGYRATPVVIVFDRDYRIRRVAPLEGPEPGRIVASLLRDLSISPELPPRS
ncbi:MAG TPA: hypothetical protein VFQ39_01240 [Longimicrobium sp.]|nr:hypothetical protein [Longimicrobium sp.]